MAENKCGLISARPEAGTSLGTNTHFLIHTLEAVRTDLPLLQDISKNPYADERVPA